MIHRGEGSLAGRGPANPARYLSARNTVLFARKHGGLRSRGCRSRRRSARACRWKRSAPAAAASGDVVALLWRGYRDGLLGREVPLAELGLR